MRTVRVDLQTYRELVSCALYPMNASHARFLEDHWVEFPVDDEVFERLARLSPDPALAVQLVIDAYKRSRNEKPNNLRRRH